MIDTPPPARPTPGAPAPAGAGRSWLITGASRGVGRMLAEWGVARGRRVIGVARGPSDLEHPLYRHAQLDVADEAAVRALFVALARERERVEVLINNAGVTLNRPALLTGAAEARQLLDVNVIGAFLMAREAAKAMARARFGRIIFISSINAPLGSIGGALYNASKAAVENLTCTLAREFAGQGVTVNALGLSMVAGSGMVEGLSERALVEKRAALIKPDDIGIAEIAHAVDFLAADQAGAITNQALYFGGVR